MWKGRTVLAMGALVAVLGGCGKGCDRGSDARAKGDGAVMAAEAGAPTAIADAHAAESGIARDLNVIVISIDSLRADMPWNGYPRPIAPRLTDLEKRAVSYTHAYAVSSYTSMSLGGFLGGKLPSEMKRSGYFFGRYAPDNVMFPELLQAKGIKTVSAHAHGYFKESGFEQGFDVWEVVPNIAFKNETDPNVTSPEHEALAEKILGEVKGRFFAWFHFLDPHDQYMPHDKDGIPAYGPTIRDRYDAEVTFTDRYIGKLLDFVDQQPWGKKTAIVITSDHGESFGEHGRYAHGFELWENLVRIPLFFVVPGVAPRRIDVPRSAIDLAPTICDMFGVEPEASAGFEGKSLVPELLGGKPEERDVVIDLPMTSDNDKRRAILHGTKKVIAFGKDEALRVYDVAADPEEDKELPRGEAFTEMAARYREHAKTVKEVPPYACGGGCLNREYAKAAPAGSKAE